MVEKYTIEGIPLEVDNVKINFKGLVNLNELVRAIFKLVISLGWIEDEQCYKYLSDKNGNPVSKEKYDGDENKYEWHSLVSGKEYNVKDMIWKDGKNLTAGKVFFDKFGYIFLNSTAAFFIEKTDNDEIICKISSLNRTQIRALFFTLLYTKQNIFIKKDIFDFLN